MGAIAIYILTEGQRRATEIAYPDAHVVFGGEFQPMSVQVTGSVACVPFAVAFIALQELNAINLYSVHGLKRRFRSIIQYLATLLMNVLCQATILWYYTYNL